MSERKSLRWPGSAPRLGALALALLLGACATVRLIAPYDDAIDQGSTEVQKTLDMHFGELGRGGTSATYDPKFYDGVRATIRSLRTRAEAAPKNALTVEQFDALLKSVDALETYHKNKSTEHPMTAAEVEPMRLGFDQIIALIMKLELAKKRGESS